MSSSQAFNERLLKMLNDEMKTNYSSVFDALAALHKKDQVPVGLCGFRCDGSCTTCKEAEASLEAFFNPETYRQTSTPVERQVMAYGGDAESNEEMDEEMRQARALDEFEEIQRANAWEYDDQYSDDGYDDRYGLSWNESGYYD